MEQLNEKLRKDQELREAIIECMFMFDRCGDWDDILEVIDEDENSPVTNQFRKHFGIENSDQLRHKLPQMITDMIEDPMEFLTLKIP